MVGSIAEHGGSVACCSISISGATDTHKKNSVNTDALVDTGAAISCVDQTLARANGWVVEPWRGHKIVGADQREIQVIGSTRLRFTTATSDVQHEWDFAVVGQLVRPVVLGLDVLSAMGAKIDLSSRQVAPQATRAAGTSIAATVLPVSAAVVAPRPKTFVLDPTPPAADQPAPVAGDDEVHGSDFKDVVTTAVTDEDLAAAAARSTMLDHGQLGALLARHKKAFAVNNSSPGTNSAVQHEIRLEDGQRVATAVAARVAPAVAQEIQANVDELLANGLIRPSRSPFAARVVMVAKKGTDKRRFCVDYRALNGATVKDKFPMPRIDDALDSLRGAKIFSTLDLASGYWQVRMREGDIEKTAFVTPSGLYEFLVMPFGLCNAPATFQRMMQAVFRDMPYVRVYLDDIVVFSKDPETHLRHLEAVFARLLQAGLHLKLSKCKFGFEELEFLGHTVSSRGIATSADKVAGALAIPKPTDVGQLRTFLGLMSYYRRFVADFSRIAEPLNKLTRKGEAFVWDAAADGAFARLKKGLSSAPILAYPDDRLAFTVQTDASDVGLGAVLSQDFAEGERPVAYFSRSLNKSQRNYSATERECLAIVEAVKFFRPYIEGASFTLQTDHEALKWLHKSGGEGGHGRVARWLMFLEGLPMTVTYRSGASNANADALSRLPQGGAAAVAVAPVVARVREPGAEAVAADVTAALQRGDPSLRPIFEWVQNRRVPEDPRLASRLASASLTFDVQDGRLMCVRSEDPAVPLLVVPRELRHDVLARSHDDAFGGHLAFDKTYGRIARRYFWFDMYTDVRRHVETCVVCQQRKTPRRPGAGLLQPIVVTEPWSTVAMDFVGPLPQSRGGNKFVLVITDHGTKWVEAFATPDTTAETTARIFLREVICRYGAPRRLLSDQGANFLSRVVQVLCDVHGILRSRTTAYHPQTDGLTERFNHTLANMLASFVGTAGDDWDEHLPELLFAYRTAPQPSIGDTPFYLTYGREPYTPLDVALGLRLNPGDDYDDVADYRARHVSTLRAALAAAKDVRVAAHERQRLEYDARHRDVVFKVGQLVWLFTPAVAPARSRKLVRPWKGPFRVLERASAVTYRLERLSGRGLNQLVHVARLKECKMRDEQEPRGTRAPAVPADDDFDPESDELGDSEQEPVDSAPPAAPSDAPGPVAGTDDVFNVERVVARRKVGRRVEYEVAWEGYPDGNTWEPRENVPPVLVREFLARTQARGRALSEGGDM